MTNNEKIQKAEQLIAEANALLSEVEANNDTEDMIAKYKEDYCKGKKYYIGDDGRIGWIVASIRCTFETLQILINFISQKSLRSRLRT